MLEISLSKVVKAKLTAREEAGIWDLLSVCMSHGLHLGIADAVLFGSVVAVNIISGFVAFSSVPPVPAVFVVLVVMVTSVPVRTAS